MNTENFYFEDFTGDYYLTRDEEGVSHLKVSEKFTTIFPDFKQNKGICREIPTTNQDGKNITLPSLKEENIKVLRNGKSEPIYSLKKNTKGDYYEVCTGDNSYVLGKQEYTFEYEYEKVITDFENYQELYWDTNGNHSLQKFEAVTARVHLAEDLRDKFTGNAWCYVGKYGESGQERCIISSIDDGMQFEAKNLTSYENLTFDMEIAPGTFELQYQPVKNYSFLIGLAVVFGVCGLFLLKPLIKYCKILPKKKIYKNIFVKPEYQPCNDYTLSEMAKIYLGKKEDYKVGMLLDLIVRKKVEIIKEGNGRWSLGVPSLIGIEPEELKLLSILNGGVNVKDGSVFRIQRHGATTGLADLMDGLEASVKNRAEKDGLIKSNIFKIKRRPRTTMTIIITSFIMAVVILAVPIVLVGFELSLERILENGWDSLFNYNKPQIFVCRTECIVISIILIILAIVLKIILKKQYAKYVDYTELGLKASRYMDGLKMYIEMAEADRLRFLQSVEGADVSPSGIVKLYERLLPYAAVFGVEKSWMKELQKYCEVQQVVRPSYFSVVDAGELSTLVQRSAMYAERDTIRPYDWGKFFDGESGGWSSSGGGSSSSSSGSGGGGFSGGGGGGGGVHGR